MTAGLTPTGFEKKTLDDIQTDVIAVLEDKFGAVNLRSSSVFTQIIGIFAAELALAWSALEGVHNSQYSDTATDSSLNGVCQNIGVIRLSATATTVLAYVTGRNQTIVNAQSEATALGINATFLCKNNILITNESCLSLAIDVTNTELLEYDVTINGYSYGAATIALIVIAINGDAEPKATAAVVSGQLVITALPGAFMSVYVSEGLAINNITTSGIFYSNTKGAIALPANSLTTIQTPIAGWMRINNPIQGAIGRNLETDNELRIRRANSLNLAGSATVSAIQARVGNVQGVTTAKVTENYTDVTVGTIPPRSFETLVLGAETEEGEYNIALAIWDAKPAGIRPFGTIYIDIIDSTGGTQTIGFSRPVKLYITIHVVLTTTALYPADGNDIIKASIAEHINKLKVNDTVIYQSLYEAIYLVPGITNAVITLGGNEDPDVTPALTSANITTTSRQIAVTDITRVTIA